MLIARPKLLLFYFLLLVPVCNPAIAQTTKKQVTLDDVWRNYRFFLPGVENIRWMKNDQFYTELTPDSYLQRRWVKDERRIDVLIKPTELVDEKGVGLKVDNYAFSEDERKVLLLTNEQSIYRHSSTVEAYVYDLNVKKLFPIFDKKAIMYPTFSPDGAKVAFCHQNNLYIYDLAKKQAVQVTTDGVNNQIINGSTDWVYEEEFAITQAFEWAPDGKKIAFLRFDESKVPEFTMDIYDQLYPTPYRFKYPKAGEKNAVVRVFFYDVEKAKITPVMIEAEAESYFPRMKWLPQSNRLAIMKLNRHQNKNDILLADVNSGQTEVLFTETSDTYISEPDDLTWFFLKESFEMIWQSERLGFNHIYVLNLRNKEMKPITSGEWEVTKLLGVDEKNGLIYYESTEESPLERHIYTITKDGKTKKRLTTEKGWHQATMSSNFNYFIHSYSTTAIPPIHSLRANNGTVVKVLQDNKVMVDRLAEYEISPKEFFQFKTGEGIDLNGWMIKPFGFDSTKKYPVLMFTYGGPGNQQVTDTYNPFDYFWYQTLAQAGYFIVCIDNRGTGGRGARFKKSTYMQLGKYETIDQIAGAKYFGSLPYIDKSRIGIWGWSFGGYLSSLCLLKGNDVFKLAIAVAPVTNWRFYDTIYTERYMRTPQENPKGYDDNSPIYHVAALKGNYLLIHGTADDNVHYQNAIEMAKELIKANKQFDQFYYPNKNHGISGGTTRLHLYNMMTNYIKNKL
jgi:dipeptidyl-peptidase 4